MGADLTKSAPHPALPPQREGVKKSIWLFFTSFRRKPESSVFKPLAIAWTPVFTGVTAEIQFFTPSGLERVSFEKIQPTFARKNLKISLRKISS
jgi:hypothetical protein